MDRRVRHRQDTESLQVSQVMTVLVGTECQAMPVVQAMGSVEVIGVQVRCNSLFCLCGHLINLAEHKTQYTVVCGVYTLESRH